MSQSPLHPPTQSFVSVDGAGSTVSGEQLKEVDAPIEGLLGAMNSGMKGALIAIAGSAAVTIGKGIAEHEAVGQVIFRNITRNHLGAILGTTAAFAAVGGTIRYRRSEKHNEWSHKYYELLSRQKGESHADRVDAPRSEPESPAR